jgi:formate/nitrite transporter FocA (FNT family)
MSSDLQPAEPEQEPKKASAQILHHEIVEGRLAIERPVGGLFLSALSAGLDVGFSLLLMAAMQTRLGANASSPIGSLLLASMYAVGFVFVVVGRSELFTEQTTLAVLPVLNRQASVGGLMRTWLVVYVANLLGAVLFAFFSARLGPALGVAEPWAFARIAQSVTAHSSGSMFGSAVLAGWLMGLLSWLVAASRDTISQIVLVWLIATVIGFLHLHHSIVGSIEVLAGIFADGSVSWSEYGRFLLVTTLGNALGGPLFVSIVKYNHAINTRKAQRSGQRGFWTRLA